MYTDPSGYSYYDSMKRSISEAGSGGFYYRGDYVRYDSFTENFYGDRTGENFGGSGYWYNQTTGQHMYNGKSVPSSLFQSSGGTTIDDPASVQSLLYYIAAGFTVKSVTQYGKNYVVASGFGMHESTIEGNVYSNSDLAYVFGTVGAPNLTHRIGNVDYVGFVIEGFGSAAEQSAKATFKYGKRINGTVKSAAQLTRENAALMGKLATRLNVAGALLGTYDCTTQGIADYRNGNTGLAAYEFSKAGLYTAGVALIIISPFTGGTTAAIGGYIILGTSAVDISGDVGLYIYGRTQ